MPKAKGKTQVYNRGAERAKVDVLKSRTHFSKSEIERLLSNFKMMCGERLDKTRFCDFLHQNFGLTDNIITERIFKVFDETNDGYISESSWVKGLSIILKGTFKERRIYTFHVYDTNSDGIISREEMFAHLQNCLVRNNNDEDPDEGTKDLLETLYKKLDVNKDSKITIEDWDEAVGAEPLLEECLGTCLPPRNLATTFLRAFSDVPTESKYKKSQQQATQ